MRRKLLEIFALVVLGNPLIIYPFVLLANAMSLAGHRSDDTKMIEYIIPMLFLISSTLYPVTYVIGWINYLSQKNAKFIRYPLLHLVVCLLSFLLWLLTDG